MIKLLQGSFKVTKVRTVNTSFPQSLPVVVGSLPRTVPCELLDQQKLAQKLDRNSCKAKLVQAGEKGLSPHLAKLPRQTPFG